MDIRLLSAARENKTGKFSPKYVDVHVYWREKAQFHIDKHQEAIVMKCASATIQTLLQNVCRNVWNVISSYNKKLVQEHKKVTECCAENRSWKI